jgi:hypothetical protein
MRPGPGWTSGQPALSNRLAKAGGLALTIVFELAERRCYFRQGREVE